jgi:methylglutaconyl-CoA hydratase
MGRSERRTGGRADTQTSGHADKRTGGRADRRTSGPADKRTGGHADTRTNGPAGRKPGAEGPRVLVSREGGVATLVLNRPDKRNALDRQTIAELRAALTACDLAADVRVVVLRGAGKDFCAGADLAELLASVGLPPEENERRAMELGDLFLALRALPKVTVAVVRGRALAGGCGLATACDVVVAHPQARFGYPEIQRGFVPAMVLTMLRRAAGEKVAFDLAATGRVLGADEALRAGLVSRVLPARRFEGEVTKLLTSLAGLSGSALAMTKQLFHALEGAAFAEGIRRGARVNTVARQTPDFRAGIAAFLKK